MNFIGFRELSIKSLRLPGDIKDRMRQQHVIDLARSMVDVTGGEPGQPPTVTPEKDVVTGRDRIAACMVNGLKKIWVRVGVFTREEREEWEIVENLHRRHDDRTALLARLSELRKARLRTEQGGTDVPASDQTITARARAEVARDAGVTPATVRKAEQRARAKDAGEGAADPVIPGRVGQGSEPPPPIRTFGVPVDPTLLFLAEEQQHVLDALDRALQTAQAAASQCKGVTGVEQLGERLRAELHRMAADVRRERPAALCPAGKGTCAPSCRLCHGKHLVAEHLLENLPAELLDKDLPRVADGRGGFVPYVRVQLDQAQDDALMHGIGLVNVTKAGVKRIPPPVICTACEQPIPCGCEAARKAAGEVDEDDEGSLPF